MRSGLIGRAKSANVTRLAPDRRRFCFMGYWGCKIDKLPIDAREKALNLRITERMTVQVGVKLYIIRRVK